MKTKAETEILINDFLMNYSGSKTERPADTRWILTYDKPWSGGGKFSVEIGIGLLSRTQIKVYEKHGWNEKNRFSEETPVLWISTFAEDETGCHELFNPQIKTEEAEDLYDSRKKCWRSVIDFDWLLEASPENVQAILREIEFHAFDQELQ